MVKGICRQVIVVQSPDPKLFDQAIFILREDAKGVTEEALLQEAKKLMGSPRKKRGVSSGMLWGCAGAAATGLAWLLSLLIL